MRSVTGISFQAEISIAEGDTGEVYVIYHNGKDLVNG